jgi:3'(2'), 5'-bisphosphate nucleotidase
MGVIYCPTSKDLYFSLVDYGAYKINFKNHFENLNLLVSVANKLPLKKDRQNFVVVGSRSHMSKETEEFFQKKKKENNLVEILAVGSSLKICMVAEGSADVYPRYAPTMEWDTAAGHAIANMAGYKILEYEKNHEIKYNKKSLVNSWFLVTKK